MRDDLSEALASGNLLKKCIERVEHYFKVAEKFYNEKIPRAVISFDLTGVKAGTSCYAERKLRFNRKLLVENPEAFFNEICGHETAHFVQRWKYGYDGVASHGREFKKVMVEVFRIPPKTTHNLDTSSVARKTKQFKYVCDCPGKFHMFGAIHHGKVQRGSVYRCQKCSAVLTCEGKGAASIPKLREVELW